MSKNRIIFTDDFVLRDDKVGIGTTNPTSKLSVVGDGNFTGIVTATGGFSGMWVSAKQYGAVGNGVTNDNVAIQNALNSLSPGGTLYIPPGIYMLDNRGVDIPSNVKIVGAGISATYLRQSVSLGSTSLLYASNKSNISIENIAFDGNNITNSNNSSLIYTPFTDYINIQNCAFINFDQQGLFLISSAHCRIKNNYFKRSTTANTQNQALTVSYSNYFGPNTGLSYDIVVDSNVFINSATIFACHSSVILNNYINGFGFGAGITIDYDPYYYTTGTRNVHSIIIDNNIITGGTGTDSNGYKCGGIENWAPYSKITNNILYKNSGTGIDQGGLYCIVSGNTIYDNGITSPGNSGIAGRYSDVYHNSSYSKYVNNVVGLTTNYTGSGQQYGYEEQNFPVGIGTSITQVSFLDNNFSAFTGNKSGEMFLLGSNYTLDVRKNGNIGIGTTNPTASLDVRGNSRVVGILTATSFSGSGANLTTLNASQLTTGTLPDARLSGTYTGISINTTGIVTATSFSGSGANLTTLNASNISSGTLNNSRLPSNISISGIATIGTLIIASGIVTSTTGIITYYGDGQYLTGVSAPSGGSGEFNTGITSTVQIYPLSWETSSFTFPSTAGKRYVIESISVSNVAVGNTEVNIITRIGQTEKSYIAYNVPIVSGGLVELLKQPIVAEPSDEIRSWATDYSYVGINTATEMYISYSEHDSTDYFRVTASDSTILTGDLTTIYTSTTNPSVLQSIHLVNKSDSGDYPISITITNGVTTSYLAKDLIIPRYSVVNILDRPKRIEADGTLKVQVGQVGTIDVIVAGKKITG